MARASNSFVHVKMKLFLGFFQLFAQGERDGDGGKKRLYGLLGRQVRIRMLPREILILDLL